MHNKTHQNITSKYGVQERLCREVERKSITSVSRTQAWKLEKLGKFPKRKKIGKLNAWLLSDLLLWVNQKEDMHE